MRSGTVEYTPITIDYVAAISRAAVLVCYSGREVWIPKSQIFEEDIPEKRTAEPEEINVAAWFCKKEGLV